MSFGFSVGDFITVIDLANKLRKDFVGAPSQFEAISDEVRSLSIVLLDVEVVLSDRELRNEQEADLKQIAHGCRNVLEELENTLDQYDELKSGHRSVSERVKRVWKRLKWEPEDIKQLRGRISTNIGLLNAFTSRLTRDNVVTLVQIQEDQGRQNILDWITPIDYALQQSAFISRRQPGTGQWLLDSAGFKVWVETKEQTLFCPGIPGAGKTIFAAIVVEELFTRFENDGNVGIAYIYYNYRRQHEQDAEDLFASLLKQLVQEQPSIPDCVKMLYNRHKDKRTRPLLDEILGILQTIMTAYSRIFIIADALDECQVSNGCRQKFLSNLFNLQKKCGANLFATSRPLSSIENEFEKNSTLEIRASEEDVRRYLDGNLFRVPGFVARNFELQEEIKTAIINAVNGMFLLAQLHLDSLTGKRSPKAIRAALKNLATGSGAYDHAYRDAMERINGQVKDQEELAKQVLSWITYAERPLAITELQCALGVEVGESSLDEENLPDTEDIVSVCAGLVTTDEESGIIRLVHYTTQEYFERTQKQWFPDMHTNIATICVTYLSFNEFEDGICLSNEEFEQRLQLNRLYYYAAHNWGYHARMASTTCQGVMEFLQKQGQVEASSQALFAVKYGWGDEKYSQDIPKQMTGLHLAAYFGVVDAVQFLIGCNSPNLKDSYSQTPLHLASDNGHLEVAQLLLDKGAEVKAADSDGWTPLHRASSNGRLEVAQLLLDKGTDVQAITSQGETPLHLVSYNGNLSVAQLLLKKGADVKATTSIGSTPLHRASSNGHLEVAQLLLNKGADVKATTTSIGSTPLHRASSNGHLEVAQLLLDNSADVNAANFDRETPLHQASYNGHLEVAQLLLDKGANVKATTSNGETPLHQASYNGHLEVVQLLLNKGADVEAEDSISWTPLLCATLNGNKAVIKLLIATNLVDVDSKDCYGSTSLSIATRMGHEDVVKLLLTKSHAVNVQDNFGRTPLW